MLYLFLSYFTTKSYLLIWKIGYIKDFLLH